MEIKRYLKGGTSYVDGAGKIPFTMETLPELERNNLVKYMAKRDAKLVEVHWSHVLDWSPGYFRATIQMPDGSTRRIWHSHEHNDNNPKWRWDGVSGKRRDLEYEKYLEETRPAVEYVNGEGLPQY